MTTTVAFAKLSGSGNDFICADGRGDCFSRLLSDPASIGRFARSLCRRGVGIGADGLILAREPDIEDVADVAARFFEADGSEVELCGNGTACFVHWAIATGLMPPKQLKIFTPAGVILGKNVDGDYVRVCIPTPEGIKRNIELTVNGRQWRCDYVVTGVPHAIIYVDDLDGLDMGRWGPAFRHHQRFQPRGVNANFVQILGEGSIAVRTFEFGVEGETLACGTGSAAAAILTAMHADWPEKYRDGVEPVLVKARSGHTLRVYFTLRHDNEFADVCLETVVRFAYSGTIHHDLLAVALAETCGPTDDQAQHAESP